MKPLGKLRTIELWIDGNGFDPSWYCEEIIVRDPAIKVKYVFLVQTLLDYSKVHLRVRISTQEEYDKAIFSHNFLHFQQTLVWWNR